MQPVHASTKEVKVTEYSGQQRLEGVELKGQPSTVSALQSSESEGNEASQVKYEDTDSDDTIPCHVNTR